MGECNILNKESKFLGKELSIKCVLAWVKEEIEYVEKKKRKKDINKMRDRKRERQIDRVRVL